MKAAYAILRDKRPPYYALVPVFPVTAETLAAYPGWAGPAPKPFAKPWPSEERTWSGELRVVKP